MSFMTDKNGDPVTWEDFFEIVGDIRDRAHKTDLKVTGLYVLVAIALLPKFGGPDVAGPAIAFFHSLF